MRKGDCTLCKIVSGVIGSTTVYEDEDFRVIPDLNPAPPGHALTLPKEHFDDICQLEEAVAQRVLPLAARIGEAMKEVLHCDGFNLAQNNDETAGQTVKYFYMHVIPGYESSGKEIVTWDPEEATWEEREAQGDVIGRALK